MIRNARQETGAKRAHVFCSRSIREMMFLTVATARLHTTGAKKQQDSENNNKHVGLIKHQEQINQLLEGRG